MVFAVKTDMISQALNLIYENNKTIRIGEIMKELDPSIPFDCTSSILKLLPNMQYDMDCLGGYKYPISIDISLPTPPKDAFVDADQNTAGIVLDSIRFRAMRTDTDKVIMDFIL